MALVRSLLILLLLLTGMHAASACMEGPAQSPSPTAITQDQLPCAHAANCCECQIAFAEDIAPAFESHKAVGAGSAVADQAPQQTPSAVVAAFTLSGGSASPPRSLPLFLITSRLRL